VLDRIAALYDAFNARDIDRVTAQFAPDVDWPNAWEGGRVVGRAAVRDYWLRQWEVIDPVVRPQRIRTLDDRRVEVLVHQVVRDRDGDLLGEAYVLHTYTFSGPLISRMDVGDPGA
jgi:nuclear transport factor 2 (NTF2) superfamily protein